MTFPVIQSVLDAAALESAVAAHYGLAPPVRCRLISRGMNDIYQVTAGSQRFALKVARAQHGDAAFAYEPAFVLHLDRAGFAVPTPAATVGGVPFFTVEAPEGARQVMLTRWLEGTPLTKGTTEEQARNLGAWLARIHLAGANFTATAPRQILALSQLKSRLPALIEMVAGEPSLQTFLVRASETVAARIMALDRRAVPRGPCHGDYHTANIIVLTDRAIGVHDFSDCGEDFWAADLAPFMWRADFDGVSEHLTPAFVAGYSAVRPLTPAERAALPLFRAARHLAMAAAFAAIFNRTGPVPGFDGNLRYYVSMVRLFCAEIGVT